MSSIAINQILILFLQCFIVALLLLFLFRLRKMFGLGLLFTALGVFQYLQVFLVSSVYIEIVPGLIVSPGSVVLFTASIFAILLIYLREDAIEARKLIYALVAANLALTLLQILFGWAFEGEGIKNIYNLPKEFFTQDAITLLIRTGILFIDSVAIIVIYELIARLIHSLFLRIFFSAALILCFDAFLFSLLVFAGTDQFYSMLFSGVISEISAALFYSALFSFYLLYLDKSFKKRKTQTSSYEDIFNSLTFRQKYEQVAKEKETQKLELQKSELKTLGILNAVDDIVFVLDQENRYTSFYSRPEDLYLSPDKFIGKKPGDVMPAYINELFEGVLSDVKSGKTRGFEYPLDMPHGTKWYSTRLSPMIENNEYKGLVAVSRDITDSKRAEQILQQTHEELTDTLESMSDGFISLNKNWIFTYVNKRAAELFGRKQEDLIGKPIWTEFPEGINHPFHKIYFKVAETRKQISFENFYQPIQRWFENQVIPTKEGLAVFMQDITERKQVSEAIHDSETRLKEAQRIAQVGSWELDLINNKLSWSDEVFRIFNLKPQQFEATYQAFLENIHPDDRAFVDKAYTESVKSKIPYDIIHRLLLKNGVVKFVKETCETFYNQEGIATSSIGTIQDITDRKKAEDELAEYRLRLEEIVEERTRALEFSQNALLNLVDDLNLQSAKLERSNDNLAAVNKELETFTYSVSHDLKAPLRGIDGYSQLLLESYYDELNDEARGFLTNIRHSAHQMNTLIEDLLAYSRMERQEYRIEKVHFKTLVDNLLLFYSKTINSHKVSIQLNFKEASMPIGDKEGLNLVMRNLLDNAIKFTSHKKDAKIEIGASETDAHWLIYVKDNGVGFDMKYHDKIFKIFHRLHLAEEYQGTGIGLAMVSKAAQRMNGKIWAESEPGKGSCFYLEIRKPLNK